MKRSKLNTFQEGSFWINPCFYYLLVVGILEFFLIVFGISVYYEHKNYLIFPVLMFFGAAFTQKLNASARRKLLLGILAVIWFLVIQKYRNSMGWKLYPFSWFPAIYLMAYPFASVTQDSDGIKGLKIYAGSFLAAGVVLIGYGVLLLLDWVPAEYASFIYFDEATRFALMWNPNITGCIFMIAAIICLVFGWYSQKRWIKFSFFILGIVFFVNLILTKSRTVVLIFSIIAGGMAFFYFFRAQWKYFLLALIAACIAIAGSLLCSVTIYNSHRNRLITKYTQQLENATDPIAYVSDTIVDYEEKSIVGNFSSAFPGLSAAINGFSRSISFSPQHSSTEPEEINQFGMIKNQWTFMNDMGTLSGRTPVWRGALRAIREDPSILIWGCEHVGDTVSLYTDQPFDHTHNSWVEITMSLGLPGALISVVFTWIALWNSMVLLWSKLVPLWKKSIALLVLGLLLAGFMEPCLFFSNQFFHYIDFMFFLCLGYVRVWVEALPRKFNTNKFPFCLL